MTDGEILKAAGSSGAPSVVDVLESARQTLWESDSVDDAQAVAEAISNLPLSRKGGIRRIKLGVLKTLAMWRITGNISANYKDLHEAQVQVWEIEHHCPVFDFQKQFLLCVTNDYPNAKGPRQLSSVYQTIETADRTPLMRSQDGFVINRRSGAKRTFIVFTGMKFLISGMAPNILDRAIAQRLNANFIVCFDNSRQHFLGGIDTIGDRRETIAKLGSILAEFQDTTITAIGGSAGVFGALHASCDLGIDHVIATSGSTSLEVGFNYDGRQVYKKIFSAIEAGEIDAVDLCDLVSKSLIKRIDFFVGGKNEYDMAHLNELRRHTNVVVPHIYEDTADHGILERAVVDGSYIAAITGFEPHN